MKPCNFPARKERRKLRSLMPKHQKVEPPVNPTLRAVRTKKSRLGKAKIK